MAAPSPTDRRRRDRAPAAPPARRARPHRWLLLVHQLPTHPSNLRVRTWRRLQALGAVAVKQAVYALPDSPAAREDFEWLKAEIEGAGGEATVFAADSVNAWSDDGLVEEFRCARQRAYGELSKAIEQVLRRLNDKRARGKGRAAATRRRLAEFRQRFAATEHLDFFGSAGRDRVVALLEEFDERLSTDMLRPSSRVDAGDHDPRAFRGRLWVTRPRPGVDRMASAWLIRRFIDPDARFDFVQDREAAPPDALPFDMFGVPFSHHGDDCTFETLCDRFAVRDAPVNRLAGIVHDLDLKDDRFGAPEAATLGLVIDGLQLACPDDHALLDQGIAVFEALYRSLGRGTRRTGPQALARRHSGRGAGRARHGRRGPR